MHCACHGVISRVHKYILLWTLGNMVMYEEGAIVQWCHMWSFVITQFDSQLVGYQWGVSQNRSLLPIYISSPCTTHRSTVGDDFLLPTSQYYISWSHDVTWSVANQTLQIRSPTQLVLYACSQHWDSAGINEYTWTKIKGDWIGIYLHLSLFVWTKAGIMVSSQVDTNVGNTKYRSVYVYQLMN